MMLSTHRVYRHLRIVLTNIGHARSFCTTSRRFLPEAGSLCTTPTVKIWIYRPGGLRPVTFLCSCVVLTDSQYQTIVRQSTDASPTRFTFSNLPSPELLSPNTFNKLVSNAFNFILRINKLHTQDTVLTVSA